MTLAPIIVFCYNRPWHVEQTLEALSKNVYADESELYIFCDGPKPDATEEQISKVRETRVAIRRKQWCKDVHIIEAEKNKGLKDSIVDAVTQIVNKYGRVITLEDDVVTSVGFLKFMNEALEMYENDERVMHISGYMWPHRWPLPNTFFFEVPYPGGGWATWQRAWNNYSDDTNELYDFWHDKWNEFNKLGGNVLQKQLEDNYYGTLSTWYVKWHAVILRMDGLTLFPGKSLTNNIGFDNSGTNCFQTDKFDVVSLTDFIPVKKKAVKTNWLANQEIYSFYQGRWYNRRRRNKFFHKIKSLFFQF